MFSGPLLRENSAPDKFLHVTFVTTVSEVESGKGSGDCLPELNYQNSNSAKLCSRIVRSKDAIGKLADTPGDIGTGKTR